MRPPGTPRAAPAGAGQPAPAALRSTELPGAAHDGHGEAELQPDAQRAVPTGEELETRDDLGDVRSMMIYVMMIYVCH